MFGLVVGRAGRGKWEVQWDDGNGATRQEKKLSKLYFIVKRARLQFATPPKPNVTATRNT